MPGEDGTVILEFRPPPKPGPGLRGTLCSSAGPSSAVVSRAWCDERRPIPWAVTGLLSELALALSTHKDYDAHSTENPCTDEPADSESIPIIVERTIFILRVIGMQSRKAC